jgi:diguanylate cyclase (GGDEF)-like protein
MEKIKSPDDSWHILIVDDSPTNIKVLAGHLQKTYSNLHFALSAQEAKESIDKACPDLILLDIMMPDVDGISFCRDLKSERRYRDIPVIFLTALADKETVLSSFEAGGVDFLTKPIHGPELIQRIQNQLRILDLLKRFETANAELNLQVLKAMESQAAMEQYQKELLKANQALQDMASKDPLTGLYNRRRAWELIGWELERLTRSKGTASLIMLDIDHFKQVNDTVGHSEGDRILVESADLFRNTIRSQDLAVRWGGEEFLIFLPDTDLEGACTLTDKILETARSREWGLPNRNLTYSAGVVGGITKDNFESKTLVADEKLYEAKHNGRDRFAVETL